MIEKNTNVCTLVEAAQLLEIPHSTLYQAVKMKKIHAFENPNFRKICKWSVDLDEVIRYFEETKKKPQTDIKQVMEDGKFLNIDATAKLLKVSEVTVYKAIKQEKVIAKKVTNKWFIDRESALRYGKTLKKVKQKPDIIC